MIGKNIFGSQFPTGAITAGVPERKEVRHFALTRSEQTLRFSCDLNPGEIVHGLGETMGGLNKRGWRCISFNTNTADHTDRNPSLYSSHNLLLVDGARHFGLFFDTPARVTFEIDYLGSGRIEVLCETTDLTLYQLSGESSYDLVRQFLRANGPSYLPPLWAFGIPEDERARQVEDQLLVGGSIMMTPIIEKGVFSRTVWLPDDMTKVHYNGTNFICTP